MQVFQSKLYCSHTLLIICYQQFAKSKSYNAGKYTNITYSLFEWWNKSGFHILKSYIILLIILIIVYISAYSVITKGVRNILSIFVDTYANELLSIVSSW